MKVKAAIIGAALAGSALVAPLSAEASLSQCSNNRMCVWGNPDYTWFIAAQPVGYTDWRDPFDGEENDQADSFANNSSEVGCLAQHVGGGGDRVRMGAWQRDSNLAVWNDNEASSMRTASGC